ncbi:hypothetical protein [Phenylobacterium sp.]|uniref:hypothetical protein n=1 Tax=Phenylobacterium sp. TaxID=1871053 RepID=UPI002734E007|nr:hypothetical protein [Phenylobacterium sp.]MDP3852891.1 hypothetical protein [Phenylobacterium sp.]
MPLNPWFAANAAVILLCAFVHLLLGGRGMVRPLLRDTELRPVVRDIHYCCWHLITILMFGMVIVFALAALGRASADLTLAAVLVFAAYGLWTLGLMLHRKYRIREMPQWILFGLIAALGAVGLSDGA